MIYEQLIKLVFTEFVHQQRKELESCDQVTTDSGLFVISPYPSPYYYRNYFESLDHMPTLTILCGMSLETERTT